MDTHTEDRLAQEGAESPEGAPASQWICQQVLLSLMQCLDSGQATRALTLLSADACWDRQGHLVQGAAAIAEVIGRRPAGRVIRHHLSSIVITVHSEQRASSRAYYSAYAHDGTRKVGSMAGPQWAGDHFAEFVRTESGWRVCYLRAERLFAATGTAT